MKPGNIDWIDLTVADAGGVRDFYRAVAGWTVTDVEMDGGYQDYGMNPPEGGGPVAGICHARGGNADFPPGWLIYITVADLEQSLARCAEQGGEVVVPARKVGNGLCAVIRDPSGAHCGLYQTIDG